MSKKSKYKNALHDEYVKTYPGTIVENTELGSLLKFNFKFLDPNQNEKGFCDFEKLSDEERKFVLCKLKEFSGDSKIEWMKEHVGKKRAEY